MSNVQKCVKQAFSESIVEIGDKLALLLVLLVINSSVVVLFNKVIVVPAEVDDVTIDEVLNVVGLVVVVSITVVEAIVEGDNEALKIKKRISF